MSTNFGVPRLELCFTFIHILTFFMPCMRVSVAVRDLNPANRSSTFAPKPAKLVTELSSNVVQLIKSFQRTTCSPGRIRKVIWVDRNSDPQEATPQWNEYTRCRRHIPAGRRSTHLSFISCDRWPTSHCDWVLEHTTPCAGTQRRI
jgi:hypothetical protein